MASTGPLLDMTRKVPPDDIVKDPKAPNIWSRYTAFLHFTTACQSESIFKTGNDFVGGKHWRLSKRRQNKLQYEVQGYNANCSQTQISSWTRALESSLSRNQTNGTNLMLEEGFELMKHVSLTLNLLHHVMKNRHCRFVQRFL
eukprot:scaffold2401_cov111-Cylindrotheca_fusiformis.AAC.7